MAGYGGWSLLVPCRLYGSGLCTPPLESSEARASSSHASDPCHRTWPSNVACKPGPVHGLHPTFGELRGQGQLRLPAVRLEVPGPVGLQGLPSRATAAARICRRRQLPHLQRSSITARTHGDRSKPALPLMPAKCCLKYPFPHPRIRGSVFPVSTRFKPRLGRCSPRSCTHRHPLLQTRLGLEGPQPLPHLSCASQALQVLKQLPQEGAALRGVPCGCRCRCKGKCS